MYEEKAYNKITLQSRLFFYSDGYNHDHDAIRWFPYCLGVKLQFWYYNIKYLIHLEHKLTSDTHETVKVFFFFNQSNILTALYCTFCLFYCTASNFYIIWLLWCAIKCKTIIVIFCLLSISIIHLKICQALYVSSAW